MSDDLDGDQIAALTAALERQLEESEQSLAASREGARPVDLGLSIGRLSRVDALQQQYMAMARGERLAQLRQQIHAALGRLADGSYGVCVRCGEGIGYTRLEARPETPFCRDCQPGAAKR